MNFSVARGFDLTPSSSFTFHYSDGGDDTLNFGAGIAPSDINLSRSRFNLVLQINGSSDQVTLSNWGNVFDDPNPNIIYGDYRVNQVVFADGTVWDEAYILSRMNEIPTVGTSGSDFLFSWAGENAPLQGLKGNDELYGNRGNDTYIFNHGDGQDIIRDSGGSLDTILYGVGISASDIIFIRDGFNLVFGSNRSSDQVSILNWGYRDSYHIERIEFADSTVWNAADIQSRIAAVPIPATDGNDSLQAWVGETVTLAGLAGDDTLNGNNGNDTLIGGTGNDSLRGGAGNDTYIFNLGDGQDTISDNDATVGNLDTIRLGAGIAVSDIIFKRSGNDLVLGINGSDDQLKIENWKYGDSYRIERMAFADSTVWDAADIGSRINAAPVIGTDGNDNLQGWAGYDVVIHGLGGSDVLSGGDGNDTLDGGIGNDQHYGGAGNDTYIFNLGDGQDAIYESDATAGNLDTIRFGVGIAAGDITFNRSGNDLVLAINGSSDQVKIQNWGYSDSSQIECIEFADATVWNKEDIRSRVAAIPNRGTDGNDSLSAWSDGAVLEGLGGNDTLAGGTGNDILDGGAGDDTLKGGAGSDTYVFGRGAGHDTINNFDTGSGKVDALVFADDVQLADIEMTRVNDDLLFSIKGSGDQVTIAGYFQGDGHSGYAVDEVRIPADNLVYTIDMIKELLIQGSDQNDILVGYSTADNLSGLAGDDIIDGRGGSDILDGGSGSDTYLFGRGSGQDTIMNLDTGVGKTDAVVLASDVHVADLKITRRLNDDLVLRINNSNDQVTIKGYFSGDGHDGHAVEEIRIQADNVVYTIEDIMLMITQATDQDDTLIGTALADTIFGLGGDDIIDGRGGDDTLIGGLDMDTLIGGTGSDRMEGGVGDDIYEVDSIGDVVVELADEGYDTIETNLSVVLGANIEEAVLTGVDHINATGNELNNQLIGNSGNNVLDGGLGDDMMAGGEGNDSYQTDSLGDEIGEEYNGGTDTEVRSYETNYLLSDNVENLTLTGAIYRGNGNDLDNIITGNAAANNLWGRGGDDTLIGGGGDDALFGAEDKDILLGGQGSDYLEGGLGEDIYVFNRGDGQDSIDDLDRAGGGDILRFGEGIADSDVLAFKSGNNLFFKIKNSSDQIGFIDYYAADTVVGEETFDHKVNSVEFAGGVVWDQAMIQTVVDRASNNHAPTVNSYLPILQARAGSLFTYVVPVNTITDPDPWDSITYSVKMQDGSAIPAWLSFDAATRTLSGTPGSGEVGSLQFVLWGTDNYNFSAGEYVSLNVGPANRAPVLSNALPDKTAALGSGFSYTIVATAFTDPDAGDALSYSATLADGSALPSWLSFNASTRTFSGTPPAVGTISVLVTARDTGNLTASDTFDIAVSVENLTLTGTSAANTLSGGAGNDTLSGLGGNDTLYGYAGNDYLDGGTGNDTMRGGTGDDTYVMNIATDVIIENANEGTDTVRSSVTATLGANVENLTLTGSSAINGTGNELDNVLVGNSAVNTLTGAAGNDFLDGGAGADKMSGGTGNDTYVVNISTDVITENATEGIDTVQSSVTFTLGANLENLTLTGTSAVNGTGNTLANTLLGNSAINTLAGGAGNDRLNGGLGNDTLTGGAGNDIFVFDTVLSATANKDKITDFVLGQDKIELDRSLFTALPDEGTLASYFQANATGTALDDNDYLLYNTTSGTLLYDADGNGQGVAIEFAVLSNKPTIGAEDFVIVS